MRFCPQCEAEYDDDVTICPTDGVKLVFVREEHGDVIGTLIDNRYRVVDKIGEGGMGSVFLANQEPVERPVAIKVLRSNLCDDPAAVKRFFHEAKAISKLRHPHTVTLYDFGQSHEGLLYIAMEYMAGDSLRTVLDQAELSLAKLVEIARQIATALVEAHAMGIVHRDLKPQNIFIDVVGGRNLAKVLDFGIAKVEDLSSNLTLKGMVVGTPAYMSPEQSQGHEIDGRSDLYSLGVMLFEMACGRQPYLGDTSIKVAMGHLLEPLPDPNKFALFHPLPRRLVLLIQQLMSKDIEQRPTADVVVDILEKIEDDLAATPASRYLLSQPRKGRSQRDSASASEESVPEDGDVHVRVRTPTSTDVEELRSTKPLKIDTFYDTNPQPKLNKNALTGEMDAESPPTAVAWRAWAVVILTLLCVASVVALVMDSRRGAESQIQGAEPDVETTDAHDDESIESAEPAPVNDPLSELNTPAGLQIDPAATEPSELAAAEQEAAMTVIRIESDPPGATITDSLGELRCDQTPCAVELDPDVVSLSATATLHGYRDSTQVVPVAHGDTIRFELQRRSRRDTSAEEPDDTEPPTTREIPPEVDDSTTPAPPPEESDARTAPGLMAPVTF